MWGHLAKYADVEQLKARAQRFKGQLSEFTQEVLQDIEESEAVAKENVERYREQRRMEQQEEAMRHQLQSPMQPATHSHTSSDHDHTAFANNNGHASYANNTAFQSSPSFAITSLSESESSLVSAAHDSRHDQMNGFSSPPHATHHAAFTSPHATHHTPAVHVFTDADTSRGYGDSAGATDTSALESTPITHAHARLAATPQTQHTGDDGDEGSNGGFVVDHSVSDVPSPADVSFAASEDVHEEPHAEVDLGRDDRDQQMVAHLQSMLRQSQLEQSEMRQEYDVRVHQLVQELASKSDAVKESEHNFAALHEELAARDRRFHELQDRYDGLAQRPDVIAILTGATTTTTPRDATPTLSSEPGLDVAAMLADPALPIEDKLALLSDEIDSLRRAARPATTHAEPTVTATTIDGDVDERVASLQSQVEDLTSQLESVSDEKAMLDEIVNELKAESEQVLRESAAAASAREAELLEELQRVREENARLVASAATTKSFHAPHMRVPSVDVSAHLAQMQGELSSSIQQSAALQAQQEADQQTIADLRNRLEEAELELAHARQTVSTESVAAPTVDPSSDASPAVDSALSAAHHRLADLQRSHDKLSLFRSQAVSWKQQAEAAMHKAKERKEELHASMKRREIRWGQEREDLLAQLQYLQSRVDSSSAAPSAANTPCKPSASPLAALTSPVLAGMVDSPEMTRSDHLAELDLLQSKLALAQQQLGLQSSQIASLQSEVRAGENDAAEQHQRELALEERVRAEYVSVTADLSARLADAQSQAAALDAQAHEHAADMARMREQLEDADRATKMAQSATVIATQQAQDAAAARLREAEEAHQALATELRHQIVQNAEELHQARTQLTDAQEALANAAAASTTDVVAPVADPESLPLVQSLRSELSAVQSHLAQQTAAANQMITQLNARYDQLMSSFTSLQARCRDGLNGEEGNLAQIAELKSALLAARTAVDQSQADADRARADAKKADQSKGELTIMQMRWREAVSEADGLRKVIKEQVAEMNELRDGGGGGLASVNSSPSASDEVRALRQQVQDLQLDAASMDSLQSDYAALQRSYDMTQTMLGESRENLDDARRALADAQVRLAHCERELADARAAPPSATPNGHSDDATLESARQQVSSLQSALQAKSQQLAELSAYSASIERDHRTLRQSFESTVAKLNQFSSDEHLVDRRLVVKLLVTFFERGGDQDEVLSLMARVLQFTSEDQSRIQRGRQGVLGRLGSFLTAPVDHAPLAADSDANLADSWINFLMQESKAEAESQATADKATAGSTHASRAARHHTPTMERESEFEARPSRAPISSVAATALPTTMMPHHQTNAMPAFAPTASVAAIATPPHAQPAPWMSTPPNLSHATPASPPFPVPPNFPPAAAHSMPPPPPPFHANNVPSAPFSPSPFATPNRPMPMPMVPGSFAVPPPLLPPPSFQVPPPLRPN